MNTLLGMRSDARGMTILELLVTMGVLSVLFALILPMYSTSYETIRSRDALVTIIHESDLLMNMIGNDIRESQEALLNYSPKDMDHTVVAALKTRRMTADASFQEQLILYVLDEDRPNRLLRMVQQPGKEQLMTTEVSRNIESIQVKAATNKLFTVQLMLQQTVAGKKVSLQTASSYMMRL